MLEGRPTSEQVSVKAELIQLVGVDYSSLVIQNYGTTSTFKYTTMTEEMMRR